MFGSRTSPTLHYTTPHTSLGYLFAKEEKNKNFTDSILHIAVERDGSDGVGHQLYGDGDGDGAPLDGFDDDLWCG